MNYDLGNLIDHETGLIGLIIEFLLGSDIKLNKNTEALKYRLVCKTFKQEIERLSHLSINLPIKRRKRCRNFRLPSSVSSISLIIKYESYKITKEDWKDIFGNELSTLESSVRHLHISAAYIEYLPKFNCLNSILWEIRSGCYYKLLENIPHKELKITRCCPRTSYRTIAHLTKLSEIEIEISDFFDHKLISEYLPLTILKMTMIISKYKVDIIDLSKFGSLKYLKLVGYFEEQLIEELRLPTSLNKLYSEVKINKINLHECKNLGVLELKFK
jgi:hypothetical protein